MNKLMKASVILSNSRFCAALLRHRTAAGVEHLQLMHYLKAMGIRTIIDIGANRGQFALVAKEVFPNATIFSFEPLQEASEVFTKVFAGDNAVRLYQVAIGANNSDGMIHVSQSDDSSSLLPISELQTALFPKTGEKETRKVQIRRLPDVVHEAEIEQPSLLKIDVQWYEKEVLAGVGNLLQTFTWIYVECSFMELYTGQTLAHEVITMLAKRNFKLEGVYNHSYDRKGLAIQGDFLFVNMKEGSA